METAISLKNVSKYYIVGSSIFSKRRKCALNDVSIEINKGECCGIIGRNGAGKSTLLKVIAGITEPSAGRVEKRGKIVSLIELGNGFHQDLSGIENLKFNAALLGMNKIEIHSKIDEIVAFAELIEVIHQPIRTYSTGMVMRLGFSIAAHLDTEILLLDEVLAVGDSFFQQKCIEKILGMQSKGRTIVVVSHHAELIRRICNKAALLENGKLVVIGNTEDVLEQYENLSSSKEGQVVNFETSNNRAGFTKLKWEKLPIQVNKSAQFSIEVYSANEEELDLGFNINDSKGQCIIHISNRFLHQRIIAKPGINNYEVEIEHHLLPGTYYLTCFLRIGETIQHWEKNGVRFEVAGSVFENYENPSEIRGSVYTNFTIT